MDDGSRKAREKGARMIMEHIQGKAKTTPFVFMGDFNAPEDSETLKIIKGNSEARQELWDSNGGLLSSSLSGSRKGGYL